VIDSTKLAVLALNEVGKLLGKLTEEQLTDLAEGRGVLEFRTPEVTVTSRALRKSAPAKAAVDLDEMIAEIKGLTDVDAVERYLVARDKELPVAVLRELAVRIGPPVVSKGTKPVLRKNIAEGTAGLLNRPASAFNTGWDR